ncbi:hypothetical protein LXL04_034422 [Taraxacum kok-saghyz]
MEMLTVAFEGTDEIRRTNVNNLNRKYEHFFAQKGETLTETFNRFNCLVNDLRRLSIEKHRGELVLKFLDSLGEKWEHHADVLKNSEKLKLMDLQSLFGNFWKFEETKALRKEIMKDSHNSRSVALYSSKRPVSDSDEPAEEDEERYEKKLVESAALIVKHFHKRGDKKFGADHNSGHKSGYSGARDSGSFKISEKKDDKNCFNCGSPDHFARDCKKKKDSATEESYETKYKKLVASLKRQNLDIKAFVAEEENWEEKEESSEDEETKDKCLMVRINEEDAGKESSYDADLILTLTNEFLNKEKDQAINKTVKLKIITDNWATSHNNLNKILEAQIPHQCQKILGGDIDGAINSHNTVTENEYLFQNPSKGNSKKQYAAPSTKTFLNFPISNGEVHATKEISKNFPRCKVSDVDTEHISGPKSSISSSSLKYVVPQRIRISSPKTRSLGIKHCYTYGDTSHKSAECTFDHNSTRSENMKLRTDKWTKRPNSLNCLPDQCYTIFADSLKRPIEKWVTVECSRHMIGFKSLLDDYVKKDGPVVTYGDNSKGQTKGFGTIKCKSVEFKNVSYVKGLKHNLVSISQLCDADYEVHFNKKEGKVIDSKMVPVLTANRQNDIYVLEIFSPDQSLRRCFFSRAQSHMNWLWHKRLSHLNFKALSKIANDQLVRGIPKMKFEKDKLCAACEKGKKTKAYFKSKMCFSISEPLHLLHMDLVGPVPTRSRSGKKYTLVIVDEFSCFTWVTFLRKKSQAVDEIISFVTQNEVLYN